MVKRLFDIFFAINVLIFLSPIILSIALIIYTFDGKPIIFKQLRVGKDKKIFKFYKFRTMSNEINPNHNELDKITKLGRFLRRSSLDELPTFYNVLKGDISIVGPRPLLEKYIDRYDSFQIRRLEVKPGVTGLAQIKGRNTLSWEKKFDYDIKYVDNNNIFIDIKIILLTILFVFLRRGISPLDNEIMSEFKGKN